MCARACVLHAIIPERAPTRTFTRALACTTPLLVVVGMHPHPHLVVHTTFAYAQHAPHNRNDHPPPAGDKVVCKFRIKDAHIPHIVACVRRHIFGPQQNRAEQSGFNYSVEIVNAHTDLNQSNNGERHTRAHGHSCRRTHTHTLVCTRVRLSNVAPRMEPLFVCAPANASAPNVCQDKRTKVTRGYEQAVKHCHVHMWRCNIVQNCTRSMVRTHPSDCTFNWHHGAHSVRTRL